MNFCIVSSSRVSATWASGFRGHWVVTVAAVCILISAVKAMQLPTLITRGTHYEVGFDMGRTFQSQISTYYISHTPLRSHWLPWSLTSEGQQVMKGFLQAATNTLPQYVDELRGLADGANLTFNEVFLVAHRAELAAILKKNSTLADAPKGCSDLHVNHPKRNTVLLGHNEDNDPYNTGFMVTAHVTPRDPGGATSGHEERFTAFSYFGLLPGSAFGFTHSGLAVTCNALYPQMVATGKLGRSFLNRALLAMQTPAEVSQLLMDPLMGSAYGFSVNVGVPRREGRLAELWNFEVAPSNKVRGSNVDAYQVRPSDEDMDDAESGDYFHVNMYRRQKVVEFAKNIVSAIHRTARIRALAPAHSVRGVTLVLGDTQDELYPIYRTPRPTDNALTLATGIYDLLNCTLSVYRDNPKTSEGPLVVYPIPC